MQSYAASWARSAPFGNQPFRPRITLARRTRIPKRDLPSLAFLHDGFALSVVHIKGMLEREGAVYKPLHVVGLPAQETRARMSARDLFGLRHAHALGVPF